MQFVRRTKPSFGEQLGAGLGAGVSQSLQQAVERYGQSAEDKAIKEKFGVDVSGIRDPQARAMLLQRAQMTKQAQAKLPPSLGLDRFAQKDTGKEQGLELEPTQKEAAIAKQEVPLEEKISAKKPKEILKKEFQKGTQKPLLLPEQIDALAYKRAENLLSQGIPTSFEEQQTLIEADQSKLRNQKALEQFYVDEGMKYLRDVYKTADLEDQIGLANEFVDVNLQNLPEVERLKKIQNIVKDYSDNIAAVKKSLPKKTWWTESRDTLSPEAAQKELGRRLKFLTDRDMFDKARQIASEAGYFPDEYEAIWGSLGGKTKSLLDSIPDKKAPAPWRYSDQTDFTKEKQLTDNLLPDILRNDPRVNLVMLRREFMQKGVPSNVFFESLQDARAQLNQETGYDFDVDQNKQVSKLIEPPIQGLIQLLRDPNLSFRQKMFGSRGK